MAGGPTVTLTFAGDAAKLNQAFDSVGASAKTMETNVGGSSRSIKDAGSSMEGLADKADTADTRAMGFRDTITGLQDTFKGLTDDSLSMQDRLLTLGMGVGDLASGFANFLIPMLGQGVTAIKAMSLALLTSPITWIVVGIGLIVAAFIYLWNNVEGFRNFWIAAWEGIKSFAGSAVDWISNALSWFGQLPGKIRGWFGAAKDGAISMLGSLVSWVRGLPGMILSALGNLGSLLLGVGRDLLTGLWNGIKNAGSWLMRQVGNFFGSLLPGWVKRMLGISSPSKVFADLGKYIPEGLAVGIEGNLAPVEDASMAMGNASMGDYMAGAGSFSPRASGAGGGATISFGGNVDSAFASAFMKLVRTGAIQVG